MLVPAQPLDGISAEERANLEKLVDLITNGDIRSTHQHRLRSKKTKPVWFALPRGRRSFEAVVQLGNVCSYDRVNLLLRAGWVTFEQLRSFLETTRLAEFHRAVFERVVHEEQERLADMERARQRRAENAASHSSGIGVTGELKRITNGEQAPTTEHPPTADLPPGRHRLKKRVRTPA